MTAKSKAQAWAAPGILAFLIAGCSADMPGIRDVKMPSVSSIMPSSVTGINQEAASSNKPVTAADYVDAQGNCAGGAQDAASGGEPAAAPARSVALAMTECQVVQRLGTPQATDITANERGERVVTMTYLSTERAGLYRFVAGRLKSIERAPGAAPAEQPAKKPQRHGRSNGPA